MRRPVSLLILALLLALAAPPSLPTAYGATPGGLVVPASAVGHDHPASDGTLAAVPHVLPDMDTLPEAAKATVHDPNNPAWITSYGTNAGVKFFPPRQPPAPATPQGPSIDVSAVRNLFPGGTFTVNGMADAPDGRVFVAIDGGGLLVYGPQATGPQAGTYTWSTITTGNGLSSNNVTSVLVVNNRLWVGTSDAGLDEMDLTSGTWTNFTTSDGLPSSDIGRITSNFVFFGTQLWLTTPYNGISEMNQTNSGTTFTNYSLGGGGAQDTAMQWVNFSTHVWIVGIGRILDFDPNANTTTSYNDTTTGQCNMAGSTRVVTDNNNVLWFIDWGFTTNGPAKAPDAPANYFQQGVCSYDGSTWTWYNSSNDLPSDFTTDLAVDYAGRVWMGFSGAAAVEDQGRWWSTIPSDNLLYNYNVTAVHPVGEDVWWGFNGQNGISLYTPNWRPFIASQMGGSGKPTALLMEANDVVVGLGTGFSWWDGSNWYNGAPPGNNSAVTAFARGPGGLLWIATAGSGLYSTPDGTNFVQHTTSEGLPSNNIRAIHFDQSGKFWVATDAGLALKGNGYWLVLNQSNSQLNSNDLRALAEDRRGRIWIGTGANGIDVYDPNARGTNAWKFETTTNGLLSNAVNALAADPSGDIWAATSYGLGQWNHKSRSWSAWDAGNPYLSVASDAAGRIWAGGTLGLAEIDGGYFKTYHVSGSMTRSDKIVAVGSDGNLSWAAGGDALAVRGVITQPLGFLPPTISDFSPAQGAPLTTLTINGSNFDDRGTGFNQVFFSGINQALPNLPAQLLSASASQLTVQVPAMTYTGPFLVTTHRLSVQSATSFTVAPAISSLSAPCIGLGNELDIVGDGFISQTSYPYAYVKIGSGPWRPADAVDPTEIRQIIRPGDGTGAVSVALGSTSGPSVTSSQTVNILSPHVYSFGAQQGVQGEQMIWGKRTIVMVTLQSSSLSACATVVDGGLATVDGGYLEWLKTDNSTLGDGYAIFPSTGGMTLSTLQPSALSLSNAVSFEMFTGYGLSYYPPMSALAGVRVHITNGPVEVLTYDIPKSNFSFVDTKSSLVFGLIHVFPTYKDTVQEANQFLSAEYAGMIGVGRVFPQEDIESYAGQNSWMVPIQTVVPWSNPINLNTTGFAGFGGDFKNLKDAGANIVSLINDSGGNPQLKQATMLLDMALYTTGTPSGKATGGCFDVEGKCNSNVSVAFNNKGPTPEMAGTFMQESIHVANWVQSGSPNYSQSNPVHSRYDENQTTSGCATNLTFRQALIDQLGYAGRVIALGEDQAPNQFALTGCGASTMPKSAMSYAPNTNDNNVFLEPVDYSYELSYLLQVVNGSSAAAAAARRATTAQTWRVAGEVDASDNVTVTMAYLLGNAGALTPPSPQASYALKLLAANQSELLSFPFSVGAFDSTPGQSTPAQWHEQMLQHLGLPLTPAMPRGAGYPDAQPLFNLRVPFPAGTTTAELLHNGHVIWSKAVSTSTPSVNVTAPTGGTYSEGSAIPITWSASETGNPPLNYMLDYSPDNGATWNPISGVITDTSYNWLPGFIPSTTQARVRVRASDDFNVGSAVSNPFAITARPPLAVIKSPKDGATFAEGQTIRLVGGSFTPNGLESGTFQWSHNGNPIGSSKIMTRTLNHIGSQVFSLEVDSNGLTATEAVTVNVLPDFAHTGIPDAWKLTYKLNPLDPSLPFQDPTNKGLTVLQDFQLGTDPTITDTDGTPGTDGQKVAAGLDPTDPTQVLTTTPVLHVGSNTLGWTAFPVGPAAPQPWVIAVSNSGSGAINWSMSARPAWLQVTPISGSAPTTVTFSALPQGLPPGTYAADLHVTAPGAAASPQTIHVTLNLFGFVLYLPVVRR
jgi:ligand-binding sensor domain-containing protein